MGIPRLTQNARRSSRNSVSTAVHKDRRVRHVIEQRGARLRFLAPYSYDLNPIEPAWALIKKRIRKKEWHGQGVRLQR